MTLSARDGVIKGVHIRGERGYILQQPRLEVGVLGSEGAQLIGTSITCSLVGFVKTFPQGLKLFLMGMLTAVVGIMDAIKRLAKAS